MVGTRKTSKRVEKTKRNTVGGGSIVLKLKPSSTNTLQSTEEDTAKEALILKKVRSRHKVDPKTEKIDTKEIASDSKLVQSTISKPPVTSTDINPKEEINIELDTCNICNDGGKMICCEACDDVFHVKCLNPPLNATPRGDWFCHRCKPLQPLVICPRCQKTGFQNLSGLRRHDSTCSVKNADTPIKCGICDLLGGTLSGCHVCMKRYHLSCLSPSASKVTSDKWTCPQCENPNSYKKMNIIESNNNSKIVSARILPIDDKVRRSSRERKHKTPSEAPGQSKFLGVTYKSRKWVAECIVNSKAEHIGEFKNEVDAAIAYDKVALRTQGPTANLNFSLGEVISSSLNEENTKSSKQPLCGACDDIFEVLCRMCGCQVCHSKHEKPKLLLCDFKGCSLEYHYYCLQPVLNCIPEGDWFCPLHEESKRGVKRQKISGRRESKSITMTCSSLPGKPSKRKRSVSNCAISIDHLSATSGNSRTPISRMANRAILINEIPALSLSSSYDIEEVLHVVNSMQNRVLSIEEESIFDSVLLSRNLEHVELVREALIQQASFLNDLLG